MGIRQKQVEIKMQEIKKFVIANGKSKLYELSWVFGITQSTIKREAWKYGLKVWRQYYCKGEVKKYRNMVRYVGNDNGEEA